MQVRPASGPIEAGGPRASGTQVEMSQGGRATRGRRALGAGGRVEQMSLCRANVAQAGLAVLTAGGSGLAVGGWAGDRLLLLTAEPAGAKPRPRWVPRLYQQTHEQYWRFKWRSSAPRS